MIFEQTPLAGAYVIHLERVEDERGFFARSWCAIEFREHGLNPHLVQCNISFNRSRGTLRGLHYQAPPRPEARIVRCTRGASYDVVVDLRPDSPTYTRWFAVELTADTYTMVYVPEGFAHGFQTLEPQTEIVYQMSERYDPALQRGVRWNDPALGIEWPLPEPVMSVKDRSYPDLSSAELPWPR